MWWRICALGIEKAQLAAKAEALGVSNPAELTLAQLHELRAWMIEEARAAAELEEATQRVPAEDVLQLYDADPDSDSLAR